MVKQRPGSTITHSLYNTNNSSTHFVEKGSFLRMRELTLNYNFTQILKIPFINNAQLSFQDVIYLP